MSTERRAALVTGASTGIGRAEAIALARAGYDIAINYSRSEDEARKTAETCEQAGAATLLVRCDVSDEDDVRAMIEAIKARFGRLDVLCNNAGTSITKLAWEFEKVTAEEWDRVFGVNVKGVFLVTKHATPLLRQSDDACIVNTNSFVGARPGPQPLPYSASKGALWTMTKALAGALGRSGIRVNGVAAQHVLAATGGKTKMAAMQLGSDDEWFRMLANQAGCWYFSNDGKSVIVNQPGCVKALETVKKIWDAGLLGIGDWNGKLQLITRLQMYLSPGLSNGLSNGTPPVSRAK